MPEAYQLISSGDTDAVFQLEQGGMKKFMKEFKEFALRGNVMDMAVGIIIGGAFFSGFIGNVVLYCTLKPANFDILPRV